MLTPERLRHADMKLNARKAAERALWILRGEGSSEGVPREIARVMKAAIHGITTNDAEALAQLRQQTESLLATTANVGWFDRMRPDMVSGELHANYSTALSDPATALAAEGRSIRVTRMDFGQRQLHGQRVGGIVVLSKDLIRFASSIAVIERLLGISIARSTDAVFATQVQVGAPTVAASGHDSTAILFDLRRALGLIPSGGDAKFHAAVGPALAKRLALAPNLMGTRAFPEMTPTGGNLAGMPCSVTEALGADVVVTDASALVAAADEVELDRSEAAVIEMDSTPSSAVNNGASPPVPVETTKVSLFQASAVALRVRRQFDWTAIRPVHSVRITGAGSSWGLDGGSPPA